MHSDALVQVWTVGLRLYGLSFYESADGSENTLSHIFFLKAEQ